jgi:hypothetical protein
VLPLLPSFVTPDRVDLDAKGYMTFGQIIVIFCHNMNFGDTLATKTVLQPSSEQFRVAQVFYEFS